MQVQVEEVGPCKKKIRVQVPPEDVRSEYEKGMGELLQSASLPGFRAGRVPRKLVEKRFGKTLAEEVKATLIDRTFSEAMKELQLEPVGTPEVASVEYDPNSKLAYEATVEVKPAFDIEGYKGLSLEKIDAPVRDPDVEQGLKNLQKRNAELQNLSEGSVAGGDVMLAEVELLAEGETIWKELSAQFTTEASRFLGVELPDFESNVLGKKVGEEVTILVELGSDFFQEQHRGKKGAVVVRLKEIKRPVYPNVNEEFAKKMGFESVEALRQKVREQIQLGNERLARQNLIRQIEGKLLSLVTFGMPEELLKRQVEENLARRKLEMKYYGVSDEAIAEQSSRIEDASRQTAERDFRLYFILEKIGQKEKIFVTERDVEKRIEEIAATRHLKSARIRHDMEQEGLMPQLRVQLREEKTQEWLLSKAQVQEKPKEQSPRGVQGEKT